MDDWPTEEEEFELMYGDEMDLLREQEHEDFEVLPRNPNPVRKSLNFNTAPEQSHKKAALPSRSSDNSFEAEFTEINSQKSPEKSPNQLSGNYNEFSSRKTQYSVPLFTSQTQNGDFSPNSESLFGNNTQNLTSSTTPVEIDAHQPRKRTTDDLFGDINDIILDEELNQALSQPKRQKIDKTTEDLQLISRIIDLRKEYKTKHTLMSTRNYNKTSSSDNFERDKRNLSLRVPKYPFVGVTTHRGVRIYVRFHSEDFEKEDTTRLLEESSFSGVLGDSFQKVWKDARELMDREDTSIAFLPVPESTEVSILNNQDECEKKLWVELYKPTKYYELLSDESTNRTMLRWIKLWDKVVFNRNPKIKPMPEPTNEKKKFFKRFELNTKLDETGRPQHKVALLCGPPGLGKTTLAHMVARHAGYNVVEINASDDRSVDTFKKSLEDATQMKSVLDQEKRPNCVVFDEIDGAPATAIDFLVKFISGTAPSKAKKGGKKAPQKILKRPIICICNDLYVPALRNLRQIAFVVNFPQTSSARLAERLMEIARRQQIKTDVGAMLALAEKSNHDVRSCLSVLHFFKAQNKPIGLSDVYRASVGQKDMQRGLFSVWQDIFEVKKSRDENGTVVARPKERMDKILNTMSSFGDHERVAQGVFENFPLLAHSKYSLAGTRTALDWFLFNDMVHRQIYSTQNYSMTGYLSFAFVVWHFVFGALQRPKLVYPSAGYEARSKEFRQKAIIQEILRGMAPSARSHNQALSLLLDVLPLVIKIIVPPLRPVNVTLYTHEEKMTFLKVVGIMIDYSLTYVQERTPQGTYQFNLEPNIEEVVVFKKLKDVKRRDITYSNKHLISREIEMEKMRRTEMQMLKQPEKEKEKALPNHLQTLKDSLGSLKGKQKDLVKKDFFGRVVKTTSPIGKSGITVTHLNDVWYSYKEGYSNAVRKRINISQLK